MRFSLRTLLGLVAIVAILAALIGGAIRGLNRSYEGMENSYAIDQTHLMLFEYVKANNGNWPTSWEDLRPYFIKYKHLGWSPDIETLKRIVNVDFSFRPKQYFGKETHLENAEPMLLSLQPSRKNSNRVDQDKYNRSILVMLQARQTSE